MMIADALGSSEGLGLGTSVQTSANAGAPTKFIADGNTLVLDEDMQPVVPGSGVMGKVARRGMIPLGYWRDPVKSAATFVTVDGVRYSMPGDFAIVEADGSFTLLGRGSQCINTAGEKVFPEEVEEALKTHPAIDDALVFGVADEKWGQAVTAVVEAHGPVDTDSAARPCPAAAGRLQDAQEDRHRRQGAARAEWQGGLCRGEGDGGLTTPLPRGERRLARQLASG